MKVRLLLFGLVLCLGCGNDVDLGPTCPSGSVARDGVCAKLCGTDDTICDDDQICVDQYCVAGTRPYLVVGPVSYQGDGIGLDDLVAATQHVAFSGSARRVTGVQVQASLAGVPPVESAWVDVLVQNYQWAYEWFPLALATPPNGVAYRLYARATDDEGKPVLAQSASFVVDVVPPAAPSFAVAPPFTQKWKTLRLSITVPETTAKAVVSITPAGGTATDHEVAPTGASPLSASVPLLARDTDYTVSVRLKDSENNLSSPAVASVHRSHYSCIGIIDASQLLADDDEGVATYSFALTEMTADDKQLDDSGNTASAWLYDAVLFRANIPLLVPACAEITAASVTFRISQQYAERPDTQARARKLLKPWSEEFANDSRYDYSSGSGDLLWEASQATGASDVGTTIINGSIVEKTGAGGGDYILVFDVTAIADDWDGGGPNNGFKIFLESGQVVGLFMSEMSCSSNACKPQLTLTLHEPD